MTDYNFPFEVDKLGQKDGENYFAIVHVDGNNMGLKFRTCKEIVLSSTSNSTVMTGTHLSFSGSIIRGIMASRFVEVQELKDEVHVAVVAPKWQGGNS